MHIQSLTLAPSVAFALAVVATVAYVLGKRSTRLDRAFECGRREQKRARAVIRELEVIARTVRQSLATHHASILQFKERVTELGMSQDESAREELSDVAEQILKPTNRLSTQIAHAYDEIRQQANLLMSFTEVRTDKLTGLNNRRAMEETLESMFALYSRYGSTFAVAILDVDHLIAIKDKHGRGCGDQILRDCAQLLNDSAREIDVVARFGGGEFVVIVPETDLAGACRLTDGYCYRISARLPVSVSAGVAAALAGDDMQSLLSRADTALYSAKASGGNCVFKHCGEQIELVEREQSTASNMNSRLFDITSSKLALPARM